ncbi:MAG: hypothetical protein IPK18_04070 [Sphingobacteriales bacterium]|jgi:RHS repeat-associated protein|nr:MAG: hypothetical protein IPK18_04070 [Sphingobacteriales bacterium]
MSFQYIYKGFELNPYRFGFNGQEHETSIKQGTFSAEYWMYYSQTGRRWNPDPITYPWQSTYSTNNNNPILYTDPTGESGELSVDNKSKTMTVKANVYIYGNKASKGLANQLQDNVNKQYNEMNHKVNLNVNGKKVEEYNLKFEISVIHKPNITEQEITSNTDIKNNYFAVVDNVGSFASDGTNTSFTDGKFGGSNTGVLLYSQISDPNSTTFAHELGHSFSLWNGEVGKDRDDKGHPWNMDLSGKQPNIMAVSTNGSSFEIKL